MPIRIKLFFILISVSFLSIIFLFLMVPELPQAFLTSPSIPLLVVLFVIVILITLTSLFLAIQFSLPLTLLSEMARKVQAGDLSQRVNIKKNDEIGVLALAFNMMLDAMQNQQTHMQNSITQATKDLDEKVKTLEDTKKATINLLEDLQEEKIKAEIVNAKDQAMLESIGDGLIVTDEAGKLVLMNKAAENLLGYKAAEVLRKSFIEVVPLEDEDGNSILPKDRPIQVALLSHKITTTTTTTTTLYYVRRDRKRFPVAISARPIISNGETTGAIEVFRDITKEKAVDKAKNEFVSLASHQLRTPLGIMKWYIEILESDEYFAKASATVREYIDIIYRSNERELALIRELLSASRIEEGRVKNAPESVDIVQKIHEIVEQMQIPAHKKEITLTLTIQNEKIPPINIDNLRFNEVVQNLIANAIEYTSAAGSVDVTVGKMGNTLSISIKDTGIGISEADLKEIFTKFFRSEKAVTQNPDGSGLGLYIAKAYVEGWGGKIAVVSTEGKGSTFTFSLPVTNGTEKPHEITEEGESKRE